MRQESLLRISSYLKDDDRVMKMMSRHGMEGYGALIALYMELRKREYYVCAFGSLDLLAEQWKMDAAVLHKIVSDYKLFECFTADDSERYFSSPYVDQEMAALEEWCIENRKQKRATTVQKPDASVQNPLEPISDVSAPRRRATVKRAADGRFTVNRAESYINRLNRLHRSTSSSLSSSDDTTAVADVDVAAADVDVATSEHMLRPVKLWSDWLDEAFSGRMWVEVQAMQSGCGMVFIEHLDAVKKLFHDHVIAQGAEESLHSLRDVRSYFSNYNRSGTPTHRKIVELLARKAEVHSRDDPYRFEQRDPLTGGRSYSGTPIPPHAPPRLSEEAVWNTEKGCWEEF